MIGDVALSQVVVGTGRVRIGNATSSLPTREALHRTRSVLMARRDSRSRGSARTG